MGHASIVCGIACALTGLAAICPAQHTLNPKEYVSPSGEYRVWCEPGDSEGRGGSTVMCTRAGERAWKSVFDFSLWDAVVTDEGIVAGYAYKFGLEGRPPARSDSDESLLWIVILDESGEVRARHAREREHPGVMSNPPPDYEPIVQGLTVVPEQDLLIVRVQGGWSREPVPWWTYRLSSGEPLGDIVPDQPREVEHGFHREIFAGVIPGAPLVLVHWCIMEFERDRRTRAARVSVLTGEGEEIWAEHLPDEYAALGEKWNWWDLAEQGIVQAQVGERGFSFCSYSRGQRLRYACEPGEDGAWSITELPAEPCMPSAKAPEAPELEPIVLDEVGRVTLRTGDVPAPPFSRIGDFAIDASGTIAVVADEPDQGPTLVLLTQAGEVVGRRPLREAGPAVQSAAPMPGGEWLLYQTGLGEDAAGVWVYSPEEDRVTPLEGFEMGGLRTASALPGGGFVGLAGSDWVYAEDLVAFDGEGRQRWKRDLFSAQDVAVTSRGEVVALEGIRNQLRFFSVDGEPLRTVALGDVVGAVNYPAGLNADVGGGLLFHDFDGEPPVYRIDASDKQVGEFTPSFEDGREFRLYGDVQASPDGALWTSDGHSLLRLDGRGRVVQVIGEAPGGAALREIRALTLGPDGRIYCINERNGAVHVFDETGEQVKVLTPEPDDFGLDAGLGSITVASDGRVYELPTTHTIFEGGGGYLVFDGEGNRVGFDKFKLGEVREEWVCKPGSDERWVLGYETVARVNAEGEIVQRIRKRANGDWLGNVEAGAAARDGSLAVVAGPDGRGARGPAELSIYGSDGSPIRTFPMDGQGVFARVAISPPFVVTCDGPWLHVYDLRAGDRPRRMALAPPEGEESHWFYVFAHPTRPEIWALDAGERELVRYALPAR